MITDLKIIAQARGSAYATQILKHYRDGKHKGSIVIGIAKDHDTGWLSIADPDLFETMVHCTVPVCPVCRKIVPVKSVVVNKSIVKYYCVNCESEIAWESFHNADLAEDAFWDAFSVGISEDGLYVHGDDNDERYFYVSNGQS